MNKYISTLLLAGIFFSSSSYYGSTTAPVTIAGAIIKSSQSDSDSDVKKHKRKDCPVCKGKGWYMSGDGIKKIDCNYCEPDQTKKDTPAPPAPSKDCADGKCPLPKSYRVIK